MLHYSSPTRRRGRQIARVSVGATRSLLAGRAPRLVRAFWWDGTANFGDALTPWLLQRNGVAPYLRPAGGADLVGVGSILEMVPEDSTAAIWGSGLMHDKPRRFPQATVLAVRGPRTRDLLGLPGDTPLGDPGLLVSKHVRRPPRSRRVAIIPHGHHIVWASAYRHLASQPGTQLVRFDHPVSKVVHALAAADLVVSSSLHGLITADAYGVPAVWAVPTDTDRHVADMKFADHHSTVGVQRPPFDLHAGTTIDELRTAAAVADPNRVAAAQERLMMTLLRYLSRR